MDRVDYLIVGAGFAGSVCAERLAAAGKRVLLIDQRDHIGGNAADYVNADGILQHRYGPHIFHTNSHAVYAYLSRFTAWRPYQHRVLASVPGALLPVPINRTTLAWFNGDAAKAKDAIYRPYTLKQWGCAIEDLDPSVLARVSVRDSYEDRYFTDTFQVMPKDGYSTLFDNMLVHRNIEIRLNTRYVDVPVTAERIIWTGRVDEFFGLCYGHLPYRSARFESETLPARQYQPVGVVNYPAANVPYTRITEWKQLTGQSHAVTTITREYPTDAGDPYWPVPKPANAALYKRYKALADGWTGVSFCGRLGTYAYLNMDAAVAQALKLTNTLLQKETAA